ncbi:MAG TPA: ATP synthase F1 subunit delta [Bacteroidota bacterium]
MPNVRVARRYAHALIDLSVEMQGLETVSKDLALVLLTFRSSRDFQLFLESPIIRGDKKKQVLRALFKKRISDITEKFLALLAGKNREMLLPDIIREFHRLQNEHLGIVEVVVTSAVDLMKEQREALERTLEAYTRKKVVAEYRVDPAVRGGFIVQVGDTVLDASVRRQLELLREKFVAAA